MCFFKYFGYRAKDPVEATAFKRRASIRDKDALESFVVALKENGIKLLALSFDLTFINIHTGGSYHEGIDQLATHVRNCMRDLVETAVNYNMYVSIVTFNRQPTVIKNLLFKILPKKVASQVYIQANTPEFVMNQNILAAHQGAAKTKDISEIRGKEDHIDAVVDEIYQRHRDHIEPGQIILMDTYEDTIRIAKASGHYAFEILENIDYTSFFDFKEELESRDVGGQQ